MHVRSQRIALAFLVAAIVTVTVTSVMAKSDSLTTQQATSSTPLKVSEGTSFGSLNPVPAPHESLEETTERDSAYSYASSAFRVSYPAKGAPSAPVAGPANPNPPGPPPCDDWLADESRRIVEENAPALEAIGADIADDIIAGDFDALRGRYAPGETVAEPVGSGWPPFVDVATLNTVNVFLADESVVYFTYALADWTDAGITSQHTVCIPMRFIDGSWYLTGIDDTTDGLEFVTSVQM